MLSGCDPHATPRLWARKSTLSRSSAQGYEVVLTEVVRLVETARSAAVRSVNLVMTATSGAVGRRIAEHEQAGAAVGLSHGLPV